MNVLVTISVVKQINDIFLIPVFFFPVYVIDIFLPTPDSLLVNLNECKEVGKLNSSMQIRVMKAFFPTLLLYVITVVYLNRFKF